MPDVALSQAAAMIGGHWTEYRLRLLVQSLELPPAGTRRFRERGLPRKVYDFATLQAITGALSGWTPASSPSPSEGWNG